MFIVNGDQAAQWFGVTPRTIQLWVKNQGAPKDGHGRYNLRELENWWLENIYSRDQDGEELQGVKLDYWRAKTRRENIAADVAEGKVFLKEDVLESWAWRVAELTSGLLRLSGRLAAVVVGKKKPEAKKAIDKEVFVLLETFSRDGEFTKC